MHAHYKSFGNKNPNPNPNQASRYNGFRFLGSCSMPQYFSLI